MTATADAAAAETHFGQSLSTGQVGYALLAVDHAMTGNGSWDHARTVLRGLGDGPVDGSEHASLYYGAPAVAFALHNAQSDGNPRAQQTLIRLDGHVDRLTRARLATAAHRADTGGALRFREYDLFYGLTGLAALLLRRAHDNPALAEVLADTLSYLVGLTRPRERDGQELPGWWVDHDPDPALPTPGGHANLGMAHGAAGILALLGHAARRGVVVDGHLEAIESLQSWFDRWRQDGPHGPWWPHWVTRDQLRTGRPGPGDQPRPSWCYGTPGIARAQQVAAIATSDHARQAAAEAALASCLTDQQIALLTDTGLCHGIAGLYLTALRATADATDPALERNLPVVADALTLAAMRHAQLDDTRDDGGAGFLTGTVGIELTLSTLLTNEPPDFGWDACLLLS